MPAGSPPEQFPDPEQALDDPEGLLAIGGDLSPERLEFAYRRGIFPWYNEDQPILWWCPRRRAVLEPEELHLSRRMRRTLRGESFAYSIDQDFAQVIAECADRRAESGTWITPELRAAFIELHATGLAHSIEIWSDETLAGGVYGLVIGKAFFGESMFSARPDGSKAALAVLASRADQLGIELIDCQLPSAHLERLGASMMDRQAFLHRLDHLCVEENRAVWPQGRTRVSGLFACAP